MTLSDPKRRDAKVKFFRRIYLITMVPFDLERPNSAAKHIWGGAYFVVNFGSTMPHCKGAGSSAPQFWGSFLFMRASFIAELPNLTWWHIYGGGLFLGVSHSPVPKGQSHSAPQFLGFSSICDSHSLKKNNQIGRGNTYGGGTRF